MNIPTLPHVRTMAGLPAAQASDYLHWGRGRLFRNRLRDKRFWVVQAMILAVTVLYAVFEATEPKSVAILYFVPASLYLFPVLYASLNFGIEGAVPTALWSTAMATPSVVLANRGLELAGEAFQVATMLLLGSVVAIRVDREAAARRRAEESEAEQRRSEMKYRSLFEGASEGILVVDGNGIVQEGNAAAAALTGYTPATLIQRKLADLLGGTGAPTGEGLWGSGLESPDVSLHRANGDEIWVQPVLTPMPSANPPLWTQVLLRDVTERHGFQRYAREIVRAQEGERQRIAQELHDVSVQSAILICRRLDAASDAVDQGHPDGITGALADARQTAEAMADELRRFSRDLRPLILDDLGLVPALKRLLLELRERSQIEVRFDVTGTESRLDQSIELALFRIGQESLRNVERHASASRISLGLAFEQGKARLTITDNGTGFVVPPLTALVSGGRLGLLGMHERALLVGGHCEVRSGDAEGTGTRVVVEVPIAERAPA